MTKRYVLLATASLMIASGALAQEIKHESSVTVLKLHKEAGVSTTGHVDYEHAKPMPLPSPDLGAPNAADSEQQAKSLSRGTPGRSSGGAGTGKQMPMRIAPAATLSDPTGQAQVAPQEYGTAAQVYTTNEVNAFGDSTQSYYPFSAAGKLFFNINGAPFVCSASAIKPGVVVTAAHCVANFGRQQFYSDWVYVPSYANGVAPYGIWSADFAVILTAYYDGSDPCAVSGVVCQDDVAVLHMIPQSGTYVGNVTGWHGYGWDGYGFNSSAQALIGQLGYPVALDSGALMERNDSQGYTAPSFSNNTIIGSLMTGGSSGGPWDVNLGIAPVLNGTSFGSGEARNTVVGVTSWGYTDTSVKQQGASSFTSGNIVPLVNYTCEVDPAGC